MLYHKRVLATWLLCFLGLGQGCGNGVESTKAYVNQEFGFTLQYPKSWMITHKEDAERREELALSKMRHPSEFIDREVVSIVKASTGPVYVRVSVRVCSIAPPAYLDGYIYTLRENLESVAYEVLEREDDHRIGGRTFVRAALIVYVDAAPVYQEIYVTPIGTTAVMFSITASSKRALQDYRGIIQTLRFE